MPAPVIDYGECLRDSPNFRQQLNMNEVSLDELEVRLEKLVKVCNGMIEGGKSYISQQAQFLAGLWEMSSYFASDQETETTATLNKLIHTLQELTKFQNILIDQASRSITKNLTTFLREDIKQMKETKGYFNKISNDLDSALTKNAAVSKSRPSDLEDASNLLTATRSCFRYTGMDYVYQISMLQQRKKHLVLDSLANFMSAYNTFFHQGSDLFSDLEPFLRQLQGNLQSMAENHVVLEKQLEKRHTYVTQAETLETGVGEVAGTGKGAPVKIEGYLFKRGQNAFRTWNRRWFYLSSNKAYFQLCYSKRNGEDVTVIEDDLRICLVRPLTDTDRRFCFEVISPTKSHVLQADSEEQYRTWLASLQQGISSALHEAMDGESGGSGSIQWEDSDTEEAQDSKARGGQKKDRNAGQILDIPGNENCADCGATDPQWASINWGVVVCIECSGIHRSLGVHITKIRGIKLDVWEPEILKVMAELGNNIVNKILEGKVEGRQKPGPEADRGLKEVWIKDKYREKMFVNKEVFKSREVEEADAWTVKRLRRRARSGKSKKEENKHEEADSSGKEALDKDEKDVDTCEDEAEESSLLESVLRASTLASSSSVPNWSDQALSPVQPRMMTVLNAEVCLFGGSLGKHHVASVELDSDQESTDGEGETVWSPPHDRLDTLTPDMLLYRAARAHNLPVMLQALALGADTEWQCGQVGEVRRAAMHQSVLSGSVMATEFLILNSARTVAVDGEGNTALHLAAQLGNTGQICLLLKHRADHHRVNNEGKEPLDIAVANSDADIVTLLRLAALNEEIRANDMTGDDDTFNDVVQEFSQMVYTHPERLQKKSEKK
eukprot:GFUD01016338.1.p1 GENE.GFUD01016338.1~~GFUD01016338.1.p1  ORF type:complete len:839 (-),score=276.93 GFUD01016338.1:342-2858(-)